MSDYFEKLVEAPEQEDSADLTDEQVEQAIAAESPVVIAQTIRKFDGFQVVGHDFRRRDKTMFWRTTLLSETGETKVLVFRPSWLKG